MGKFEENIEKFNVDFINIEKDLENKKLISDNDIEKAGVYALYISAYQNDYENRDRLILPIYIGQSKNLIKRKKQHYEAIQQILSLTKKEFNERLKKHQERTYLYFKIRKCLEECDLTIENIHMKVLEYCVPEKNVLEELELKYIEKYFGIQYGFNQFETVHYIPQFKADEEYFFKFLSTAKQDLQDCIDGKYFFGFRNFNIKNLCFNVAYNMRKMSQYTTENKNLIKLNGEVIELYDKIFEYYGEEYVYVNLDFIYEELAI